MAVLQTEYFGSPVESGSVRVGKRPGGEATPWRLGFGPRSRSAVIVRVQGRVRHCMLGSGYPAHSTEALGY